MKEKAFKSWFCGLNTRIIFIPMAMRAFTATRSLAAKAPAMHGSWGQTAVGGQHKTKLVKDWFQGASAFAKEHGVVEMARRFFIDKDIRYMLPYVKKVGEDQFGNEYFEDNGTVENPQMKTRQRSVNAHQNSMVCDTLCVMISGSFGMAARTTSCSTFLWRPLLSRQSDSHGCTTWMIAFPLQVSLPRHQLR